MHAFTSQNCLCITSQKSEYEKTQLEISDIQGHDMPRPEDHNQSREHYICTPQSRQASLEILQQMHGRNGIIQT